MANNLAERIAWHAAQKLSQSSLRSGYLSTFRLTLLALNDFDYTRGGSQIDDYFDGLAVSWRTASTRAEALDVESAELLGDFHYPLNIQGNKRPEVGSFVKHLKSARATYKQRYLLKSSNEETA